MKRALALAALLQCTAAHGQAGPEAGVRAQDILPRVERWSLCQREFITPLLETRQPVPEVVAGAHAACASEEEALRQGLLAAHGPAQAAALMAMMKEQTDSIMCGLLQAVRQPRDGAMTFATAGECLRGEVRVRLENRPGT